MTAQYKISAGRRIPSIH